jgi:hypothetical protein
VHALSGSLPSSKGVYRQPWKLTRAEGVLRCLALAPFEQHEENDPRQFAILR